MPTCSTSTSTSGSTSTASGATTTSSSDIQSDYGIAGAFVFCLDEPDRHPAFRAANDRTLEFCARSDGRLIPFVRLDITEKPIQEAERAIAAGARGIKLHPRAQKFDCDDERLDPVFELAADRKVPILIHGGRGLPPIADHLSELVDRYAGTQLIIAHAGIADQAGLFGYFSGREGVYFDTSVWSPLDLINMYQHVSPEQVLYASDYPYGQQPGSLIIALRTARTAGLDGEQVRGMLAGNAQRIVERRAVAAAHRTARRAYLRAADPVRAHPPVPLDGDAAPLDTPARHDRRARPCPQRLARTGRLPRRARPHP